MAVRSPHRELRHRTRISQSPLSSSRSRPSCQFSEEDLRRLLASADDRAGHHILWMDRTRPPLLHGKGGTPAHWEEQMQHRIRYRFESFQAGNGYVGRAASQEAKYVKGLYEQIKRPAARAELRHF